MKRRVQASTRFEGPWWFAAALLGTDPDEVVAPVLEELRGRAASVHGAIDVERGAVQRGPTTASVALSWRDLRRPPLLPEMQATLQVVEIDPNQTEARLVGELADVTDQAWEPSGHRLAQRLADDLVARFAARLEAAVARHLGTHPGPHPGGGDR